jgi:hypothetical protein
MINEFVGDHAAFEPDAIETMSKAFSETCIQLKVFAGDRHGREVIATRIIDLARTGVVDAAALRDRVLAEAQVAA